MLQNRKVQVHLGLGRSSRESLERVFLGICCRISVTDNEAYRIVSHRADNRFQSSVDSAGNQRRLSSYMGSWITFHAKISFSGFHCPLHGNRKSITYFVNVCQYGCMIWMWNRSLRIPTKWYIYFVYEKNIKDKFLTITMAERAEHSWRQQWIKLLWNEWLMVMSNAVVHILLATNWTRLNHSPKA